MFYINIKRCFVILLVYLFAFCYAEPRESDLDGVTRRFLLLRFIAPFKEDLKDLTDKQLFELSCNEQRVKSYELLILLKKKDPVFYEKLMSKDRENMREKLTIPDKK